MSLCCRRAAVCPVVQQTWILQQTLRLIPSDAPVWSVSLRCAGLKAVTGLHPGRKVSEARSWPAAMASPFGGCLGTAGCAGDKALRAHIPSIPFCSSHTGFQLTKAEVVCGQSTCSQTSSGSPKPLAKAAGSQGHTRLGNSPPSIALGQGTYAASLLPSTTDHSQ